MRFTDWPERLNEVIEAADARGFSDMDYCATFAADCVLAMTGQDPMAGFRGMSREEAERALKDEGVSFVGYLTSLFGDSIVPAFAQRGDVVVRNDSSSTLGICMGRESAFLADQGVIYEPTLDSLMAFRAR